MRDESVRDALRRRALGYETDEVSEEYSYKDGEEQLIRRKVTKKAMPPDITAAKILLDEEPGLAELSDEALAAEKERLLALLKAEEGTIERK